MLLSTLSNVDHLNDSIDCKLDILKSPYVHMKNETVVFEKIKKIISQGKDKLQFITDFDQTVTKQHEKGVSSLNSFEIFFESEQLPKSSLELIDVVHLELKQVLLVPTVSIEKRIEALDKVCLVIHREMRGFDFDRREIEKIVRKHGAPFRSRSDELFSTLTSLNIPVVLFSAGLQDVMEEQLKQENINYDNIQIIANSFKFEGSMLNGLENYENKVTPFNKHEHLSRIIKSETFENRKNIILMGDNTGDATIVRDIEDEGTVLKIGFAYNQTKESLEIYKNSFDIVLDDDQTMDVVLNILKLF